MYIKINDIIGEARIDLSYPIMGRDGSGEIVVVTMFSNNVFVTGIYRSAAQNRQESCVK